MSELIDTETQSFCDAMDKLLTEVYRVAEVTRVLGMEEPLFRGGETAWHSWDGMVVAGRELKPGYFLVRAYDKALVLNPDPFTRKGLKDCLAWILKYDKHHAKWSVEAWSVEKGDRSFSRLARSLKTFPRPGSTAMVAS
ncbi:unnamed protein product [marine sediment metagenome]|uniref:Uncharacterized protein n=1 Tax=marine sediment metagenome TaxID=412755 RepID=X1UF16_9ZZZZ